MPWILADPSDQATRWYDDIDVALHGVPIRDAVATVSGELLKTQQPALGPIEGRTSVSGFLSIHHKVFGTSLESHTEVSGTLGYVYAQTSSSWGSSSVSGDLMIGVGQFLAGTSAGSSTVEDVIDAAWQWDDGLWIIKAPRVTGGQVDDLDPPSPNGSARSNEQGRRFFTPRSSGHVVESR